MKLNEDPTIIELLDSLERADSRILTGLIAGDQKQIFEAARAGRLHTSPTGNINSQHLQRIHDRADAIHRESVNKIYGVGVTTTSINFLNPYNQLKLENVHLLPHDQDITRYTYRRSGSSDKPVALFNSLALDGIGLMSTDAFLNAPELPEKERDSVSWKEFSKVAHNEGLSGFMVFNFEADSPQRRRSHKGEHTFFFDCAFSNVLIFVARASPASQPSQASQASEEISQDDDAMTD